MSDYLTHLAARALGVAETARPRRSIFEPRLAAVEPLALETDGAPGAPAEPEKRVAVPSAPGKAAPTSGPATAATPDPEEGPEPSRAGVLRRAPGRALRAARRAPRAPAGAPDPPPEPRPRTQEAPLRVDAAGPEVSREPSPRPARETRAEPPLLPLAARPSRPVVQKKEAPPPTVRVTIGRVDVRAVTPEPRPEPKRTTKPPARMSLDEYLSRPRERSR